MTNDQIQKSMDYKQLAAVEFGKRILKDLDRVCSYHADLFDASSQRITDFNLGKNAVVRYIHKEIEREIKETKEKAEHKEII